MSRKIKNNVLKSWLQEETLYKTKIIYLCKMYWLIALFLLQILIVIFNTINLMINKINRLTTSSRW